MMWSRVFLLLVPVGALLGFLLWDRGERRLPEVATPPAQEGQALEGELQRPRVVPASESRDVVDRRTLASSSGRNPVGSPKNEGDVVLLDGWMVRASPDGEVLVPADGRLMVHLVRAGSAHVPEVRAVSVSEGRFQVELERGFEERLQVATAQLKHGGATLHLVDTRVRVGSAAREVRLRVASAPVLSLRDAETGEELGEVLGAARTDQVPGARPRWPTPGHPTFEAVQSLGLSPLPVAHLPAGGDSILAVEGYCWRPVGPLLAEHGGTLELRRAGALQFDFEWGGAPARRIELLLRTDSTRLWMYPAYAFGFDLGDEGATNRFQIHLPGLEAGGFDYIAHLEGESGSRLREGSVEVLQGEIVPVGVLFPSHATVDVAFHFEFEDPADPERVVGVLIFGTDAHAGREWKSGRRWVSPQDGRIPTYVAPRPMPPGSYMAVLEGTNLRWAFRVEEEPHAQEMMLEVPALHPTTVQVHPQDAAATYPVRVVGWRARLGDSALPDMFASLRPRLAKPVEIPGTLLLPTRGTIEFSLEVDGMGARHVGGVEAGPAIDLLLPERAQRLRVSAADSQGPALRPEYWWYSSWSFHFADGTRRPAWPTLVEPARVPGPEIVLTRWGAQGGSVSSASEGTFLVPAGAVRLSLAPDEPGTEPRWFELASEPDEGVLRVFLESR